MIYKPSLKFIFYLIILIAPQFIYSATYYVRTTGNNANDGTSAGTAWLTVAYAVSTVASGDIIDIGTGTFAESNITISTTNITLDGAGTGSTIMDGNGLAGSDDRAFLIQAAGVTVKDLKIKDYNSSSHASPSGAGIRVKNTNGTVTIQNVIFENNQTTSYGGGLGVVNDDVNTTSVTVNACTFNGNDANGASTSGGAIWTNRTSGTLNVTINGGTAVGTSGNANTATNNGGGIYFDGSTLTIDNASVRYNTCTTDGAAIYLYTGTANIDNATIANNTASDDAGGIYCATGTTLNVGQTTAVTFGGSGNGNTATARGGAILFNGAVLNIDNTTISYNRCKQAGMGGGGIYLLAASTSANIDVSVISDNSAAENVAGIVADGGGIAITSGVSLTCNRVKFFNNVCEDDGSAIVSDGTLTLTNCLFYGNTAYDFSAIYCRTGTTTTITNCTVANNTENGTNSNAAGIGCTGAGTTMTIKNTIAYGNANRDIHQGTSATVNLEYSDYGSISAIGGTNTANINSDPLFTNSGTNDFTLQSTSPCLEKATYSGAPSNDYAGTARTKSACGGNGYDIGCYENSTNFYQYFRSRATGNWSTPGSWDVSKDNSTWVDASTLLFSEVPCKDANTITIRNTHNITMNSTETADQLTIDNGGTLTYSSGTLTLYNGTGTDLTVNGTFTRSAANDLATNGGPAITIAGTYKHNIAASGKSLPTATWSGGSNLEFQAVEDAAGASVAGDNQSFQNVTFNFNQPTASSYFIFGNNSGAPTIGGNCSVSGTGSGAVYFGNATNTSITITGDLNITAGNAAISGASSTTDAKILQVNGAFSISGGKLDISKRSGGGGSGTLKVKGNFSMTGGSIEEGNINTAGVEFNQTNGSTQNITFSSATIAGVIGFTVKTNAVVNMGFAVLTGSGSSTFTTESGATLKLSDPGGISSSGATGNIQFTGSRTFNGGTNYEYNNNVGNQVTGNGLPTTLTGDLKINNTASNGTVTLSQSTTLNGSLTLTAGRLITTSSNLLTLGNASTSTGGSTSCYISGPVKRNFNSTSEFIFRIGKNGEYAQCSITPTSTSAESWTVEYFDVGGGNYTSLGAGVDHVSKTQYWKIDRTGTAADAQIKLYWASGSGAQGIDDYTQLLVCRYNGTAWEKAGGSATAAGNNTTGNVISGTVTSFSPFTLGSATSSNPLPIELISLNAERVDNTIVLEWKTSSEINNDFFTVERSTDAVHFESIGKIKGAGNSVSVLNYTFIDENPVIGTAYYRLRQTDYNGYSEVEGNVIPVQFNSENVNSLTLYPNPTSANTNISVSFSEIINAEKANLKICNSEGKIIYENELTLNKCSSVNEIPIDLNLIQHFMAAGLYNVIIQVDGQLYSKSLLIK